MTGFPRFHAGADKPLYCTLIPMPADQSGRRCGRQLDHGNKVDIAGSIAARRQRFGW